MLIDTHILIWIVQGVWGNMGLKTQSIVGRGLQGNTISTASLMEIRLKQRRGKLNDIDARELQANIHGAGVNILEITPDHAVNIPDAINTVHADPFDLAIVAQAIVERLPLLTCDKKILDMNIPGLQVIDGRK